MPLLPLENHMKLLVRNRREAEESNEIHAPHIIVSIFTPGDEPPVVAQNECTKQVLQFAFDDLDREPAIATHRALGCPVLFGDEEAKEIAEKVEFWRKNGVNFVICHCDAGVSRSAGTAAAIAKYYNDDDGEFFNCPRGIYVGADRAYRPNMLVYRKLLEAFSQL